MLTGRKVKFTVPGFLDSERIHEGIIVDVSLTNITINEDGRLMWYNLTDPHFISVEEAT
jgi:hypothetical protein